MVVEIHNRKKPKKSAVEMAIAAVEGNPNPLDMDMRSIDPDPTSLDLTLPGKPDNRHAAEMGAARGGAKGRSLRREKRPAAALRPQS